MDIKKDEFFLRNKAIIYNNSIYGCSGSFEEMFKKKQFLVNINDIKIEKLESKNEEEILYLMTIEKLEKLIYVTNTKHELLCTHKDCYWLNIPYESELNFVENKLYLKSFMNDIIIEDFNIEEIDKELKILLVEKEI